MPTTEATKERETAIRHKAQRLQTKTRS
jgi:hypothetical protein